MTHLLYTQDLDLVLLIAVMGITLAGMHAYMHQHPLTGVRPKLAMIGAWLIALITVLIAWIAGNREMNHNTRFMVGLASTVAAELEVLPRPTSTADDAWRTRALSLLARQARASEFIDDAYVLSRDSSGSPVVVADGPDDRNGDGDQLDEREPAAPAGAPAGSSWELEQAFAGHLIATHTTTVGLTGAWLSAYVPLRIDGRVDMVLGIDSAASRWLGDVWATRAAVGGTGLLVLLVELIAISALRADETRREQSDTHHARDRFLATVSHELRTPLNGIIGLTEILRDEHLRPNQADLVRTIHASARAMIRLVNDLLDLSKISAGKMSLEDESFCPLDILSAVVEQERVGANVRKLDLRLVVEGSTELLVVSDPVRFRQIVANLVNNAVKYTKKGHILVRLFQRLEIKDRVTVTVMVEDTGVGIPPELAARLFEPFARAKVGVHGEAGSGLGLAVAHELALRLGGTLDYQSRSGHGSTFTFRFQPPMSLLQTRDVTEDSLTSLRAPLAFPDPADLSLYQSHPPPREQSRPAKTRVLVAEDNPVNQRVVKMQLERLGLEVELADNGREAMRACRAQRYSLVLMDLSMPELDGIEATKQIRNFTNGHQPIILALTASVTDSDRRRCELAGMNGFLEKPLTQATLRAALQRWLPGHLLAMAETPPPQEPGSA